MGELKDRKFQGKIGTDQARMASNLLRTIKNIRGAAEDDESLEDDLDEMDFDEDDDELEFAGFEEGEEDDEGEEEEDDLDEEDLD